MRRFQIYYRLVDLSFWFTVIWLGMKIVFASFSPLSGYGWIVPPISSVLFPVNVLFATFLVLARFMRDELAERIWQITARRFVYFLVAGPLTACLLAPLYTKRLQTHGPELLHPDLLAAINRAENASIVFISGILATLVVVAVLVPQIFILFYKWGLWRESR